MRAKSQQYVESKTTAYSLTPPTEMLTLSPLEYVLNEKLK